MKHVRFVKCLMPLKLKLMHKQVFNLALLSLLLTVFGCQQPADTANEKSKQSNPHFSSDLIKQEFLKLRDPKLNEIPLGRTWDALKQLNINAYLGDSYMSHKTLNGTYPYGWSPVDDFFATLSVTKLVHDPNNISDYYFCTGEGWFGVGMVQGAGVWKSSNAGETWTNLSVTDNDTFIYCQDMIVHPDNSYIYVATRMGGIQRSKDGGASWQTVLSQGNGASSNEAADIEITKSGGLFASMGYATGDGIYYSETGDSGDWNKLVAVGLPTSGYSRIEMATAPSNDSVIYAVMGTATRDSIFGTFRSLDKGAIWEEIPTPGSKGEFANVQSWYNLILKVDPNNDQVVAAGGFNLYRSQNGGLDWQRITRNKPEDSVDIQYVHVDQHEIVFQSSDTVYFCNDGGIYRCDNFTDSVPFFYTRNQNYNATQFYALAFSQDAKSDLLIGGTQDNFSIGTKDANVAPFQELQFGDGGYCAINYNNNDIMYTTKERGGTRRFVKGFDLSGRENITNRKLSESNVLFINPIEMDPNDPEILYMTSNQGLWRLSDASTVDSPTTAWEKATRTLGQFSAIGISKSHPNVVFIGTTTGVIFRAEDAHQTDEDYFPESLFDNNVLPSGAYLNSIFVNPDDANHVIIAYSNYGVESVFETKDALSDDPEWTSHEGNLPDIPVYWALIHPEKNEVCYVATEIGVFYTDKLDASNTNWVLMNEGMANVKSTMIKYRKSDSTVFLATYGRGIFQGKLNVDGSNDFIWQERGPNNVGGRTRTLMIDPNDPTKKKVWTGNVSGGLWKTENIDSVDYFIPEPMASLPSKLLVYPNPIYHANASLQIQYQVLAEAEQIELKVFSLQGKLISTLVNEKVSKGIYNAEWTTGKGVQSGYYIIELISGDAKYTTKVVVLN